MKNEKKLAKGRGRPKKQLSEKQESKTEIKKETKNPIHASLASKQHKEKIGLVVKHSKEHKEMAVKHKKEMMGY